MLQCLRSLEVLCFLTLYGDSIISNQIHILTKGDCSSNNRCFSILPTGTGVCANGCNHISSDVVDNEHISYNAHSNNFIKNIDDKNDGCNDKGDGCLTTNKWFKRIRCADYQRIKYFHIPTDDSKD